MVKRFLGLFAVALIAMTAAPVLAQPATPAPSARQIELASQIQEATGAAANFDANIKAILGPMMQRMAANAPAQNKAATEGLNDVLMAVMTTMKPKMIALVSRVYAETYSEEELTGILAFYRSPAGQAMLKKTPVLAGKMGAAMAELQPEMWRSVMTEVCKRTECPPALTGDPSAVPPPSQKPSF
jgi:hypothetical protein